MDIVLGQKLVVTIKDLAFGGEGVARLADFVVFVPFVLPEEEVEIEVTEVKRRFARGRLLQVLRSSSDRVKPQCRYFGECGGCQYQHVDYAKQLEIKRKQVADVMQRIGRFAAPVVDPVIPCPQPYAYRNRIMIRSQWDKFKQALNIGFVKADSGLVVDVEECAIAEPALNDQIRHARANPPPKGGIKVVLRVVEKEWEVPNHSFFQNNTFQLPNLIQATGDCLRESGVRFLIDTYCGVGFFSLELASKVEAFAGVEYDRSAVFAARKNQQNRNIANGEYIEGKTELMMAGLLQRFPAAQTAVILDPPRTGCQPSGLHSLREAGPAQILYVSCHPATLARDLEILCLEELYELKRVIPIDMFPQTQHIECIADLRLKKQN
jgi:tRNA/tmRNA/rRNA uracil-C5-methylase (TrmA/RlmC/RlmD family)